jgi:hypothetical protein
MWEFKRAVLKTSTIEGTPFNFCYDETCAYSACTGCDAGCDAGMDVAFVVDYTGSMGGVIETAKAGISDIITTIKTQSDGNFYRLSLVLADEFTSATDSYYETTLTYSSLPSSQKVVNTGLNSRYQWSTSMENFSLNNEVSFKNQLNKINSYTKRVKLSGSSGALRISINGNNYGVAFNTDLTTTVTNFVNTNRTTIMSQNGLLDVVAIGDTIEFRFPSGFEPGYSLYLNNPTTTTLSGNLTGSITFYGMPLGYGVGGPEPTDMAIDLVVNSGFTGTFRENVAKYLILITDAEPGGNDDQYTNVDDVKVAQLRQNCVDKGIKVLVLGTGASLPVWQNLATTTGGGFNTSFNATTLSNIIINNCNQP